MFVAFRTFIRLPWISRIAVVPVFAAVSLFAQSAAGPGTAATPATPAPALQALASEPHMAPCKHSIVPEIPLSSTIQAKVAGTLNSGRLKVGKEIWVNVVNNNDVIYPGCTLKEGSILYGHVTAATTGQGSNTSELSLTFDHADCEGQLKKEMPLRLVALLGPSENVIRIHEELPLQMRAAHRNINDAVTALNGSADKLNKGDTQRTFQPGDVIGIPGMKLEIEGGPGCSSRISSEKRSVQLDREAELILVVELQWEPGQTGRSNSISPF
jgi:hypothetical protein